MRTKPHTIEGPKLPEITPELRRLLEQDILARGILVPIVVAGTGEIIDGVTRAEIAGRHRLPLPKVVVGRLEGQERERLRLVINTYRRHLTREQVQEVIAWELRRAPEDSDRQVAGRIGVDHKTVGSSRRLLEAIGEIPRCDRRTRDGRRYPASRKPVVITNCEAQARVASRLLDELGDDAPGGPLSVRTLKNLAFRKRVEAEAAGPAGKLPPEITLRTGDFRKFDWSPYEGRAAMIMADPPWLDDHAELRRPLAELAARLLPPEG